MSVADWVGITTLIVGVIGAALGAFWARSKPRNGDSEGAYRTRPHVMALHEDDRTLFRQLVDALTGGRKAIEDHTEMLSKHRHAVGDNTAERRRDQNKD